MNTTEHHMTRIRSLIEIEMNKLLVSIQTQHIFPSPFSFGRARRQENRPRPQMVILHSAHEVFGPGPEARPVRKGRETRRSTLVFVNCHVIKTRIYM
jgi:hypothetical protein